ncbi:MAG: LysE family transporter [Oscillatoriales cyanobacterium RM2_1_1]|nr:LysE family transporter [Oscillatoriales cyanobacterium SM2_3_0]NJO46407.1 LysE family transporter [Oscillatoriales cyanobacterium RM2_1_1]
MKINGFLKGLLMGFSIAAPVGPIGVLCIRRTLTQGRLTGLMSGLGAASADAVYGGIAGFGLTLVANFLVDHSIGLRIVGGIFLIYLGVKTALAKPVKTEATTTQMAGAYGSTFFLTLTNPGTILSFLAVFAGLGLVSATPSYLDAGILVLGIFLGSALWWLLLTGGVELLRETLSDRRLRWINSISGGIILSFGLIALGSLIPGALS